MFDFFKPAKYSGSTLQKFLEHRKQDLLSFNSNQSPQLLAEALIQDQPNFLDTFRDEKSQPISWPDEPKKEEVRSLFLHGIAMNSGLFIAAAFGAANFYGQAIDEFDKNKKRIAFVIATILAHHAEAVDLPARDAVGGYRRHLSGCLLLKNALEMFGVLGDWQQILERNTTEDDPIRSVMAPFSQALFMQMRPPAERSAYDQVMQHLQKFKATLALMPDITVDLALRSTLQMPKSLWTGAWGGGIVGGEPDTDTCTFCNGSGRRSGCNGCNGTGRLSRMNSKGEVEITGCAVCGGTGRARCDMCMGRGRV